MSIRSVLLRLFFAAALIINGSVAAVASVHTHPLGAVSASFAPELDSAEEPACDDHASTAADRPVHTEADENNESSDCCESGDCRCGCVHQASTDILLGMHSVAPPIGNAASVRPMATGHAGPALPHLIRPPIG